MILQDKVIAKIKDLKNGEMKEISLGEGKSILLCKIDDKFYAHSAHCTHYGAPLADGVLNGDRIVCPWHHACFNAKNGNMIEPPARDSLPNYEVRIENENVIASLPEELEFSREPEMAEKDTKADNSTFVILGAGVSGNAAAQAMREAGFQGNIIMITRENHPPYDRPNLSKEYLQGEAQPEWMPLRSEEFYSKHGIEIMLNKNCNGINAQNKLLFFENGEKLNYDKLLITSGGEPRKLNLPGSELKNIFYLRSFTDADKIIKAAENSTNAVVIGGSFIGLEAASSLIKRGLKVTVVAPEKIPFQHIFGEEIGSLIKEQHEKAGVHFKLHSQVKGFEGNGKVQSVFLKDGSKINADLVVAGIGVKPATSFADGIELQGDGSIKVDSHFRAFKDVYAAGDIATFPHYLLGNKIRIEHYRTAEQLGRIAGFNMADRTSEYKDVPFFWTVQAGLTINYVGHTENWDEVIIDGNVHKKEFIAYYIKNNLVAAAAGCNRDKDMAVIQELMRLNKMPEPEAIRDNSADLFKLIS